MALYALVTVLPLTVQFLADHLSRRLCWILAASMGVAFAAFGLHFGHNVSNEPFKGFFEHSHSAEQIVAAIVLWLLVLPFLQSRLITERWWPQYSVFFAQAWRNLLTLAEAALFTGLFWALLFLCDALFRMLGVRFFGELYKEEIFSIPVTWLTFGVALHLITGMDRLATVVLQQLLNVLKWLAIPAVVIVAFFSVALALTVPGLVGTGKRAIEAAVLLWVTAIVVLLFNAAYRDGETEQPYPRFIALALRALMPLTLVLVFTAAWSLYVRTSLYGLTVERTWGWVVAGAAIAFSVGYSACAFRKGRWMQGLSQVNVAVVLAVIAIVALALTPVLSPYRLSANSQYRVVLSGSEPPTRMTRAERRQNIFRVLRFEAGEYGKKKLATLASIADVPDAAEIQKSAQAALVAESPWAQRRSEISIERLRVYPKDHALPEDLKAVVLEVARAHTHQEHLAEASQTFGLFLDLTGDGVEEFVMLTRMDGLVFEHLSAGWRFTTNFHAHSGCPLGDIVAELEAGRLGIRPPRMADLTIGSLVYDATPEKGCENLKNFPDSSP
jgi:hypothetical protein